MPTYEYRCGSCGRSFDVVQSFHDAPLATCEVCGGTLRKVFAPVGIVFKGSGFYKTDSRSGSSRSSQGASKDEGGSTAKEAASTNGADASPVKSPDGASSGSSDKGAAPASTPAPAKQEGAKAAPAAPKSS
jgi:putative FmdB family regulatory protein